MGKRVGKFACPRGVVAILLPYRDGKFSATARAKAVDGAVVSDGGDRVLVSMENKDGSGYYEVRRQGFRPERGRGTYTDELGTYYDLIDISYVDALPKRYGV